MRSDPLTMPPIQALCQRTRDCSGMKSSARLLQCAEGSAEYDVVDVAAYVRHFAAAAAFARCASRFLRLLLTPRRNRTGSRIEGRWSRLASDAGPARPPTSGCQAPR